MSKVYMYRIIGKDQYKVIRVDEKLNKGIKNRYKEYLVDLSNGDMLCDCPGFMYTKKACKHIKFILEQLMSHRRILDIERPGDYDKFMKHLKVSLK